MPDAMTKIDKQREQLGLTAINLILQANPDLKKPIFSGERRGIMGRIHDVLEDFQVINEHKGKPRIFTLYGHISKPRVRKVFTWGEGYQHRYVLDPSCNRPTCGRNTGKRCLVLYPRGRDN